MAATLSRPSGRRADDVRALRFRFRQVVFSGSYATGGETITAKAVGLKRILGVIPLDTQVRVASSGTGFQPVFDISTDGTQFFMRMIADAAGAAGASIGQERSAGAYTGGERFNLLFVGE